MPDMVRVVCASNFEPEAVEIGQERGKRDQLDGFQFRANP